MTRFRESDRHVTADRETALACLAAGIDAAHPERAVEASVSLDADANVLRIHGTTYDLDRFDRVVVLGGGKAAAGVAAGLEAVLGDRIDDGAVVATAADGVDAGRIAIHEGDHPTPTARNVTATGRVLDLARAADASTLVLAVVTGGASALWCAPGDALDLAALRATTDALLDSGAAIDEVNAVRTHLSAIKGGGLARVAAPATVVTLAVSDVVGDDPTVIGSGPTVAPETTPADALAVLDRYDLRGRVPAAVVDHLEDAASAEPGPEAGDADASRAGADAGVPNADADTHRAAAYHLLANGRTAVEAARDAAVDRGYDTLVLSSHVRGEAREAGRLHAAIAEESRATGDPIDPPAVVVSGGEVTVTVEDVETDGDDAGRRVGGPNQELALAAAIEFASEGTDAILASVDTDGIDGPTDAAGAIVDRETVDDPAAARAALDRNDAGTFLEDRDALLRTGYTGTNVNDLRVLVIGD